MLGAILGDIVGSSYESFNTCKYRFDLLTPVSSYTDDSIMTLAVAEALVRSYGQGDDVVKEMLIDCMKEMGRNYPFAGYGGMFRNWLISDSREPYYSYGNGSAMRVSSAGWLYDSIDETRKAARLSAEVTHNHPEGIKGAEAVASAIYMARMGCTKETIKRYIKTEFDYDLDRRLKKVLSEGRDQETCQISVPQSLICFLKSCSFTDAIRKAVCSGGDSDTVACITGSIAEAYYGFPYGYFPIIDRYLNDKLKSIISLFNNYKRERNTDNRREYSVEKIGVIEPIDMETYIRKYHKRKTLFWL